jgi:hypothetical protein
MVLASSLSSRGTDEPCRSFTHVDAGPSRSVATPQHHVVISIATPQHGLNPRNVVSPEHGLSTHVTLLVQSMVSAPLCCVLVPGLRIISFITGLTNNAGTSRSIATPQHHVVISILPHSMVSTPRNVVSPEHGLSSFECMRYGSASDVWILDRILRW